MLNRDYPKLAPEGLFSKERDIHRQKNLRRLVNAFSKIVTQNRAIKQPTDAILIESQFLSETTDLLSALITFNNNAKKIQTDILQRFNFIEKLILRYQQSIDNLQSQELEKLKNLGLTINKFIIKNLQRNIHQLIPGIDTNELFIFLDPKPIKADDSDIVTQRVLGQGFFGKVELVEIDKNPIAKKKLINNKIISHRDNTFVIKTNFDENQTPEDEYFYQKEIRIGDNIRKYVLSNYPLESHLAIMMPILVNGTMKLACRREKTTLNTFLSAKYGEPHFNPVKTALELASHIWHGLKSLHFQNYLHADMASRNILLSFDENDNPIAKVADYGLAERNVTPDTILKVTQRLKRPLRWSNQFSLKSLLASQVTNIRGETESTYILLSLPYDIFAFGVTLLEILAGLAGFETFKIFPDPSGEGAAHHAQIGDAARMKELVHHLKKLIGKKIVRLHVIVHDWYAQGEPVNELVIQQLQLLAIYNFLNKNLLFQQFLYHAWINPETTPTRTYLDENAEYFRAWISQPQAEINYDQVDRPLPLSTEGLAEVIAIYSEQHIDPAAEPPYVPAFNQNNPTPEEQVTQVINDNELQQTENQFNESLLLPTSSELNALLEVNFEELIEAALPATPATEELRSTINELLEVNFEELIEEGALPSAEELGPQNNHTEETVAQTTDELLSPFTSVELNNLLEIDFDELLKVSLPATEEVSSSTLNASRTERKNNSHPSVTNLGIFASTTSSSAPALEMSPYTSAIKAY